MKPAILRNLRAEHEYPAVSIVMPTHRHRPENRQDPIRLRSLLDVAERRLREMRDELPHGHADRVIEGLEKAVEQVDLAHAAEGLVLMAAPDGDHHAFVLPHVSVVERVVFDTSYATRDLVAATDFTWRYRVLALAEQPTRLFDGEGDRLVEVENALFPMAWGGQEQLERGTPSDSERRLAFFRQIEQAMGEMQKKNPLPLVVTGVQRALAHLDELAAGPVRDAVIGTVEGSYDSATPAQLAERIEPVLAQARTDWQAAALAELDPARSAKRLATGLTEVWELAGQGRVDRLYVEEGYLAPARMNDGELLPADAERGRLVPDAVDNLIEAVMDADGHVAFVADGSLTDEGRVAARLRY